MGLDAPLTLGMATTPAATAKLATIMTTRVVDPKKPLFTAFPLFPHHRKRRSSGADLIVTKGRDRGKPYSRRASSRGTSVANLAVAQGRDALPGCAEWLAMTGPY